MTSTLKNGLELVMQNMNTWAFSEPWLIRITKTVAMQIFRKIGSRCVLSWEDIHHDLVLAALRDPSLVPRLMAIHSEADAQEIAYRFAETTGKRYRRRYLSKWGRLHQLVKFDA